jgi:Flp pilus assembly pilin Flp
MNKIPENLTDLLAAIAYTTEAIEREQSKREPDRQRLHGMLMFRGGLLAESRRLLSRDFAKLFLHGDHVVVRSSDALHRPQPARVSILRQFTRPEDGDAMAPPVVRDVSRRAHARGVVSVELALLLSTIGLVLIQGCTLLSERVAAVYPDVTMTEIAADVLVEHAKAIHERKAAQ